MKELPAQDVMLPFGFRVRIRKASRRWLKAHGYGRYGGWGDYSRHGAALYICEDDPIDEQLDTLTHEFGHAVTDWTGIVRRIQRRVQREMRATALAQREAA